jgi:hypothetical protein
MMQRNNRGPKATEPEMFSIVLTFDTDPDAFDPSLVKNGADIRDNLAWRGIEEGIPLICEVLSGFRDSTGAPPRMSWMVRADDQIRAAYDDAAYLFLKYGALWQERHHCGDEIGWHPHLYRNESGRWIQETTDDGLCRQLSRSWEAVKQSDYEPVSTRVGEAYASNSVFGELERLGIKYDSTAMPGPRKKR